MESPFFGSSEVPIQSRLALAIGSENQCQSELSVFASPNPSPLANEFRPSFSLFSQFTHPFTVRGTINSNE